MSNEKKYCLTAVDRHLHWPELIPLQDIKADTVANGFVTGWVSRFGCPDTITTDRGRQFEAYLFKELSRLIAFIYSKKTTYHPAGNGTVERFHTQLKSAIICHATEDWCEVLPLVLLGIRAAWKEDIGSLTAELVYGKPLQLLGEFIKPSPLRSTDVSDFASRLRLHLAKLSPVPASRHGHKTFYVPKTITTTD